MTSFQGDPGDGVDTATGTVPTTTTPNGDVETGHEHEPLAAVLERILWAVLSGNWKEFSRGVAQVLARVRQWAGARPRRVLVVVLSIFILIIGCDAGISFWRDSPMVLQGMVQYIVPQPKARPLTGRLPPPLESVDIVIPGVGTSPERAAFNVYSGPDVLQFALYDLGGGAQLMRIPAEAFHFAGAAKTGLKPYQHILIKYKGEDIFDGDIELAERPRFLSGRRKGCRRLLPRTRATVKPSIHRILDKMDARDRFTEGVVVVESEGCVLRLPNMYLDNPGILQLTLDGEQIDPDTIQDPNLTMDFLRTGRGTSVAGFHELRLTCGSREVSSIGIIDTFAPLAESGTIELDKESTWVYEPALDRDLLRANKNLKPGNPLRPPYSKTELGTRHVELKEGEYTVEFQAAGLADWAFSIPFTHCFEAILPYGAGEERAAFKLYHLFHPENAGQPQALTDGVALDIKGGDPNYEVRFPRWADTAVNLKDDGVDTFTLAVDVTRVDGGGYRVEFRQLINGYLVAGIRISPHELPASFTPEIRNRLSPELVISEYRVYYTPPRLTPSSEVPPRLPVTPASGDSLDYVAHVAHGNKR